MRAQCCICHELFENDSQLFISALQCGHTFHGDCLRQWLENGNTCPSCRQNITRNRIIERLYFDQPEELDENVDSDRLQNEIDRLKLELRKKDRDKKEIQVEKEALNERFEELKKAKSKTESLFKSEQSTNVGLRKQLQFYESQQKSLDLEREECRKIKRKLVELQSVETLLNGSEGEASDIITSTGDGPNAVMTLSRQVAFLKREFEKVKNEKKQMKEHLEKIQLNDVHKNKKISESMKQISILKDQLERSEGDLKLTERQLELTKKKYNRLRRGIESPRSAEGSASFSEALNDSIQLSNVPMSTPKLDRPANSQNIVDLDVTPDLFDSPVSAKSQTKRPLEEEQENRETKILKISSAAEKFSNKKVPIDRNTNWAPAMASMNIFKKKVPGESSYTSVTRKGYDGLGGHTTFVNPKGNPFRKPALKKTALKNSKSTPALPTLHDFITITD